MLKYDFHVTEQDYIDFNMHAAKRNPSVKRALILLRLVLPVMLAAMLLISNDGDKNALIARGITYLIISVIWFFIIKPLYFVMIKLNLKAQLKQSSHLYTSDGTLIFDEESFTEITPLQEMKYSYKSIEGISLNKGSVYLYLSSLSGIIIPASLFASDAERERLVHLLRKKRPTVIIEGQNDQQLINR